MTLPSGRPRITAETPGPALAVLAIICAGASALVAGCVIAFQLKHRQLSRRSKLDLKWNIVLTIALIICICQSAVTADQVSHGLGYPTSWLTVSDIITFEKLEYASNLLYIGALLALKVVQHLLQIATTVSKPNYWGPGAVSFGMVIFFFVAAFECHIPFWKVRGGQCIDKEAFWIAFGLFDIVSDLYSNGIVFWASSNLRLDTSSKVKLLIVVGSKFLPACCAVARLPFVHAAYASSNYTIGLYELALPTQLQLHISIVALSLGKIFRFLHFLDVGYLSCAIEPTHGKGTQNRGRTKTGTNFGFVGKLSKLNHHSSRHKDSQSEHDSSKNLVVYGGRVQTMTEVERGNTKTTPGGLKFGSGRNSSDAESSADPFAIHVHRDFEIREETPRFSSGGVDDEILPV